MTQKGVSIDLVTEMFGERQARWYQVAALHGVENAFERGLRRVLVELPTGCHEIDTPILMFDGTTDLVQHIQIGDLLMGPDSKPRTVKDLHTGTQQMVRISPLRGGEPFVVNLNHILSLISVNEGTSKYRGYPCSTTGKEVLNISVREWLTKSASFKSLYKLYRSDTISFPIQEHLPLDPYFLGVFLGDGSSAHHNCNITTADSEIVQLVEKIASEANLRIRVSEPFNPNNRSKTYHLVGKPHPIRDALKQLQIYGLTSAYKFVPQQYLIASVSDRLQLLAGLLDSDGYLGTSCFEFSSKSLRLAINVVFIARSLGFRATKVPKIVNEQLYYSVHISGDTHTIPTRIPRKQASVRKQKKSCLKTGFSVELLDEQQYFGFEVDGDNLYVMGDFTVTHNSGKTLTSGLIFSSDRIRKVLNVRRNEKLRLLFVTHKNRLRTQAEREYADAANIEFIPQSAFSEISPDVLKQGWHIACIDEAHHEAMLTIQYKLEQLGDRPILGLTATPDRADGCLIKFEEIIAPLTRQQAVDEGWLAPTYIHTFVDTSPKDKSPIIGDIITNYGHLMGQSIVFMKTRAEVSCVWRRLHNLGYKAVSILNQTDREVDAVLDQFSAGEFQFVVNCNMINEGVDVKNCQSVVLGRQYGSYPQLNQVIGRASRPDSDCRVWELINPLSATNLDTTVVVGVPEKHTLYHKIAGHWNELEFDYVSHRHSVDSANSVWSA